MTFISGTSIEIPGDPFPEITKWIQAERKLLPNWTHREPRVPNYEAWNDIQQQAIAKVENAWATGNQTVVGCGVTGFGKTRVAEKMVENWTANGLRSIFYTHRKAIFRQTHTRFMKAGIDHGCRASGYSDRLNLDSPVQLAMIPSERASVKQYKTREHHDAHRIIIDEAHANAGGFAKEVYLHHLTNEANVLLLTATPVGLGDHQAKLVYFGRPSEMRDIGAIVRADVMAPSEADLADIKKVPGSEFSSDELAKRFMVQQIVGSVVGHFIKSNPELRPSLLFAPDVESSLWFCDEIRKAGISACSIDGEDVYFGQRDKDGERIVYKSNEKIREYAELLHRLGIITVVCNRFVFVMGVDWPWIEHIIFATAFGGIHTWIQACGRGMRAYVDSGKSRLLIQDHGGNWHRHPSPNSDIEWCLDDTPKEMEKKRKKDIEEGRVQEGLNCPKCRRILSFDTWKRHQGKCCFCGFSFPKSERQVIQTNGELKLITGPVYQKKKKAKKRSKAQEVWDSYFWRLKNARGDRPQNFKQLLRWFNDSEGLNFSVREAGDCMMIRDLSTGIEEKLARVPSPGSAVWSAKVRETDFRELQSPAKSVPREAATT